MKFGMFYEHQLPRPWDDHAEHHLLRDALDDYTGTGIRW